ncbi:hypothetical protein PHAVU_008G051200 [Phaseolus vulgaris]|uniref:Uncharacterized protein n=1 Tax=Phaseolus vulgaris TaxID=3885 RepID=V7B1C3_PHAVU|nr:hypothetical protein PHAVU_008G051200g [Phaseolus vulgaris]ESW11687.1 hypothetical protein PHAVU_008G051200g [Phaseolus vulgaris]
MKCKKHTLDVTSNVGVCASCLRERLIALIAAQAQAQAHHPQAQLSRVISRASDDCSRTSDPNPPAPLVFPRSVSPYVSRRKSDYAAAWQGCDDRRERLFYSTPQLGPTFCGDDPAYHGDSRSFKKRLNKFRMFARFFRSRSDKFQSDPPCEQSSYASSSWFSSLFPVRRRNKDRTAAPEEYSSGARRQFRPSDRGMSPVRTEDFGDDFDQSSSGSGYISEASPWWRRTPTVAPKARRSRFGHIKSASGSGMALCLSPLVRASPNRRWNHKGLPPEMTAAEDARSAAAKPHLSAAASFCANRSRKLADFGRVNHNR